MTTTDELLTRLKQSYATVLANNLVGIYLHGSYVLGGYNPQVSDLDYVIVVEQPLTLRTKQELMTVTLDQLWPLAPKKGLEFHVLLRSAVTTFHAPCPFDFHFSKYHYDHYVKNPKRYLQEMQGTDPDLAAHLTIIKRYGQTLVGPAIDQVFGPVAAKDYWDSLMFDIEDAQTAIFAEPVYVVLNLCRVLAYHQEQLILSKAAGGAWGLENLPAAFHPLITAAIQAYSGQTKKQLQCGTSSDLMNYADWMLAAIND
ncbi:DUF4111 domain-containing protein [Lactiplantibacillus garii]|uniref:Spectinomycin 9-adenylyltransferase n=1 Tax=Lactiplantibacillus garii TaxID=2306423 RepID=A0A3R8KKF1_9LACO|nr:aminoglycoside adenylyltransferase domain-containing protein [Lactiplantibacillus garii]RRK09799.1 DUF4111 domain-containing protein [Lactiplantibacillus garii]